MDKTKTKNDIRTEVRQKRDAVRKDADAKRRAVRAKVRQQAANCLLVALTLGIAAGCNTATPASKSASSKACDNVTTVNNYIGLLPCPATNGAAYATGALALGPGGLTISVSDLNGTIAQSADTEGGDSTDLTANPSMAAGITGDAPIKAIAEAVSAFASPQDAMSATFSALVKKYGWSATTNTLVSAAESCADGSCSEKDSASVK
jgi:hypothetical protein